MFLCNKYVPLCVWQILWRACLKSCFARQLGLFFLNVSTNILGAYKKHFVCKWHFLPYFGLLWCAPLLMGGGDVGKKGQKFEPSSQICCNTNSALVLLTSAQKMTAAVANCNIRNTRFETLNFVTFLISFLRSRNAVVAITKNLNG